MIVTAVTLAIVLTLVTRVVGSSYSAAPQTCKVVRRRSS